MLFFIFSLYSNDDSDFFFFFFLVQPYLNIRYEGTNCAMMTQASETNEFSVESLDSVTPNFEPLFLENYKREFGFLIPDRALVVDDVRVRAVAKVKPAPRPQIAGGSSSPKVGFESDID